MEMSEGWPKTYDEEPDTSIPTWTHSQNSLAAEALNLKISSLTKKISEILMWISCQLVIISALPLS